MTETLTDTSKKCYIKSIKILKFGKIKDLKIEFDRGFNVIYGKNEAGKSTILLFLKAMFYGMPGRKRSGEAVKEREKAVPWDEKFAEGIITVFADGTDVEIRRRFGKTAAGDKIDVTNALTGDPLPKYCRSDLGEIIFGISEEVFLKTLMISQSGAFMGGRCDELTTRLMNLKSGGDEEFSADSAIEKLDAYANKLKCGKGKRLPGRIDILKSRIEECKRERFELVTRLKQNEDTEKRCSEAKKELKKVEIETEKIEKEIERLKKVQGENFEKQRIKTIKTRISQIEDCQKKINDLKNDTEYLLAINVSQKNCEEAEKLVTETKNLSEEITNLKNELFNLERQCSENKQKAEENNKTSLVLPFALYGAAVSLVIRGVVLIISGRIIPGGLVFVLAIASALIGFAINKKILKAKNSAEILKNAENEMLKKRSELSDLLSKKEIYYREVTEKTDDILRRFNISDLSELSKLYFKKCGFEERLKALYNTKTELEAEVSEKDYEDVKKYIEKSEVLEYNIYDDNLNINEVDFKLNETEAIIKNLRQRQLDLNGEIKGIESKMAYVVKNDRLPSDIDTEIETAKNEIKEYKRKLLSVRIAAEALKKAGEARRGAFVPKLNEKAAEILAEISDRFDGGVRVSEDYMITLSEADGIHTAEYLSFGAYEQVYFALRYAMCKLICPGLPVFLDDILTVYDDDRAQAAIKFINADSLAENGRQGILFTCKKQDRDFADDMDANIINI